MANFLLQFVNGIQNFLTTFAGNKTLTLKTYIDDGKTAIPDGNILFTTRTNDEKAIHTLRLDDGAGGSRPTAPIVVPAACTTLAGGAAHWQLRTRRYGLWRHRRGRDSTERRDVLEWFTA